MQYIPFAASKIDQCSLMQRGNMNCGAFQAHQMRLAQNAARIPGYSDTAVLSIPWCSHTSKDKYA